MRCPYSVWYNVRLDVLFNGHWGKYQRKYKNLSFGPNIRRTRLKSWYACVYAGLMVLFKITFESTIHKTLNN